jgi:hypothetical protein
VNSFVQRHSQSVTGMLSGFDRVRFRGTLRLLANASGLGCLLGYLGILLKDFKEYAQAASEQIKSASLEMASTTGRPIRYLSDPSIRKEEVARQIAIEDGITQGLICVLSAVEPCWSFHVHRNRQEKRLELVSGYRKCLHLYHYYQHPLMGFMHARLQTWFPFNLFVCINGREWLARQMDQAQIDYVRRENCFTHVEDVAAAQSLLDRQLKTNWSTVLGRIGQQVNPGLDVLLARRPVDYYWSAEETEWASDVMFRKPAQLASLYPRLIRHGMESLGSGDVMRFLGQADKAQIHGNFTGEVVSDLKQRPEGMRIKHRVDHNAVKMYDKQESVLRVETIINNTRQLKVLRRKEGQTKGKPTWQKMRKGVADLKRRAQVSQACNERYLNAMATVEQTLTLGKITGKLCQPVIWKQKRSRALNPLSHQDLTLLEAAGRGEFMINGLRNRDIQQLLYATPTKDEVEKKRRSAAVTRKLRLLRAHGLIRKVSSTHRYMVTDKGRLAISVILAARNADAPKLAKAA